MQIVNINIYAKSLYSRVHTAKVLKREIINAGSWEAKENMCHHNVIELHEFDNNYIRVRGWLYFKDFNKFVSHSVVKTPKGKLVDITPRSSCIFQDYPFLEGNLTEEEYINLVDIQAYAEINL